MEYVRRWNLHCTSDDIIFCISLSRRDCSCWILTTFRREYTSAVIKSVPKRQKIFLSRNWSRYCILHRRQNTERSGAASQRYSSTSTIEKNLTDNKTVTACISLPISYVISTSFFVVQCYAVSALQHTRMAKWKRGLRFEQVHQNY